MLGRQRSRHPLIGSKVNRPAVVEKWVKHER
jgi:hypothetical protein